MIRTAEYNEIFDIAKSKLSAKYTGTNIPTSTAFEEDGFNVLEDSVAEWNNTRPEENRLEIEVVHVGGSRFPDGYLHNKTDGEKVGIEVKFHKSGETWDTLGNSAVATKQIPDLDSIMILFGNFGYTPPQFLITGYASRICDISRTHYPRYEIDMSQEQDFCSRELGISFDRLRNLPRNQREIIINSYMAQKEYTELTDREDRSEIQSQAFILFPEIFSNNHRRKYKRLGIWLYASGIFCPNVRDFFTGSGKRVVDSIGNDPIPKVFYWLKECGQNLKLQIGAIDSNLLKRSWSHNSDNSPEIPDSPEDRLRMWVSLACSEAGGAEIAIDGSPYNFKDTIERVLGIQQ
ncbi:MAG: hypothetical protein ACI3W5_09575 [Faecousia sp.]